MGSIRSRLDNLDYRLRAEEGMNKTIIKFPKGNTSALIKYLKGATDGYAASNPGSEAHPWGPMRYCLTAGLLKAIMEDEAKGAAHVDTLFADPNTKKSIEEHDKLAGMISHITILIQLKLLVAWCEMQQLSGADGIANLLRLHGDQGERRLLDQVRVPAAGHSRGRLAFHRDVSPGQRRGSLGWCCAKRFSLSLREEEEMRELTPAPDLYRVYLALGVFI